MDIQPSLLNDWKDLEKQGGGSEALKFSWYKPAITVEVFMAIRC